MLISVLGRYLLGLGLLLGLGGALGYQMRELTGARDTPKGDEAAFRRYYGYFGVAAFLMALGFLLWAAGKLILHERS